MQPTLLQVSVLTLFPEMFPGPLGYSLAGKALNQGIFKLNVINIRDFANSKHGNVDDKSFGGGAGMVLRPDILGNAIEKCLANQKKKIIYFSPRGQMLTQSKVKELLEIKELILICGRFEGIDERVIEEYDVEEISLGDYILSGGEIAALALLDACVRLLPGVLKNQEALSEESFGGDQDYAGLLEYPHYTRPNLWKNRSVPEVLMSGNHQAIKEWRLKKAQELTENRRKDLWKNYKMQNSLQET